MVLAMYYINLERCPERRKETEELFPTAKRVEAFDGEKLSSYENIVLPPYDPNPARGMKPSQLACSLSHIKAIKTAYDNGDDGALILEDDMSNKLEYKWKHTLDEVVSEIQERSNCISFHCSNARRLSLMMESWFDKGCLFSEWSGANWGTATYYISREGMVRIMKMFYRDGKFNLNIRLKNYVADEGVIFMNLKTVSCNMPTVISRLESSTIQDNSVGWRAEYEKNINKMIYACYGVTRPGES